MAQLFKPIKSFLAAEEQPKTQESLRLQFLGRRRSEHPAALDAGITDGDILDRGAPLQRSKHFLASLYSLLRFFKIAESAWDERFPGWRSGIAGFTILASIVLVLNITALVWAATHLDDGHYATLAVGSYESISNHSGRISLGINILSTALLAGSSYCMQCLSSPTRAEVDAAHARGSYLNVGSLSWRNVLTSRKRRVCLLLLLTLSSVIIHPIYDTSFMMTTPLHKYTSALITSDYRIWSHVDFVHQLHESHGPTFPLSYNGEDPTDRLRYIHDIITNDEIWDSSLWENISASDCTKYGFLQTDRSTLLIVLNGTPEQIYWNQDSRLAPHHSPYYSYILQAFLRHELYPIHPTKEKGWASRSKWQTQISYCLSRKVPGRGRLQIHLWLLLAATVLNAIKLGCLLSTFKEQQETPLVTTGDFIASFLKSPCVHSGGMSLLCHEEIVRKLKKRREDTKIDATIPLKEFKSRRFRYYHAISISRWIAYISSYEHSRRPLRRDAVLIIDRFLFMMLFAIYQYYKIRKLFKDTNPDFDLRSSWKAGFARLDDHSLSDRTLCYFWPLRLDDKKWAKCRMKYGGVSAMILANLPQLALSAIYLCLNHQLTLMVQLRDWASLASRRQAIRVSDPEPASDQVATYWLSLPYSYSIPLLFARIFSGWLVSQTLFVVRYTLYDDISIDDVPDTRYTLAFSIIALIYSLVFGLLMFGVSVAIGFCECSPGMPLGPSNSLVIAAACHPPETDRYAARKMVKWGAIPTRANTEEASARHYCTITSRRVEYPIEGRRYG